jgi:predicted nucleic acid-binding protein
MDSGDRLVAASALDLRIRYVHLKFLRAGRLDLKTALNNLSDAEKAFLLQTVAIDSAEALRLAAQHGCSSYDAEFVVLAQQLGCPLLTFDEKLLQLFPNVAVRPEAEPWRGRDHHKPDPIPLSRPSSQRKPINRAPPVPTSTSLQIWRGHAGHRTRAAQTRPLLWRLERRFSLAWAFYHSCRCSPLAMDLDEHSGNESARTGQAHLQMPWDGRQKCWRAPKP